MRWLRFSTLISELYRYIDPIIDWRPLSCTIMGIQITNITKLIYKIFYTYIMATHSVQVSTRVGLNQYVIINIVKIEIP